MFGGLAFFYYLAVSPVVLETPASPRLQAEVPTLRQLEVASIQDLFQEDSRTRRGANQGEQRLVPSTHLSWSLAASALPTPLPCLLPTPLPPNPTFRPPAISISQAGWVPGDHATQHCQIESSWKEFQKAI